MSLLVTIGLYLASAYLGGVVALMLVAGTRKRQQQQLHERLSGAYQLGLIKGRSERQAASAAYDELLSYGGNAGEEDPALSSTRNEAPNRRTPQSQEDIPA